jgi:translocation and assembly module TamA
VGDVQADELTWVPDEWNYSAGPGLRYDSPVGLFRLDVGFRLNDPGVFTDEPTWAAYFGFGETF